MLYERCRLAVPLIAVGCVFALSHSAHADWPQPRADAERTGVTIGTGEASAPVPYWRYYLGGQIKANAADFVDVDGDGEGEILYVAGGKLVAKERTNATVWESKAIGARWIVGIDDLDGDGANEIVVAGSDRVYVVDPLTGGLLWEQSGDDLGTLGGARLGDLDGDGLSELMTQECGCCRLNNGNTGFVYQFAQGFANAAQLWVLPEARCGGSKSMVIVDVDGDGTAEVTNASNTAISVLDGASGAVLATSAVLGERMAESQCTPVDIDGTSGDELVCVQSTSPLNLPGTGHRVFVLAYSAGDPGSLDVLWEQDVGDFDSSVGVPARHIADLDGDGLLEVVLSGTIAGDVVNTYVFDAQTGAPLATVSDEHAVGTVAYAADQTLLLTSANDSLSAWTFDRASVPAVAGVWALPDRRALITIDASKTQRMYGAANVVVQDLNLDGNGEIVTAGTVLGQSVIAYDVSSGTPLEKGSMAVDTGDDILTAWVTTTSFGESPRLLVAPTNGVMELLDVDFTPLSPGVRFGGYYTKGDWRNLHLTPVTAELGAGADSIVITDSRGTLVRIDGIGGTLSAPTQPTWEIPDTNSPAIIPGLNGADPGIICVQHDQPDADAVSAYDVNATRLWTSSVPGVVLADVVPANLDGDGVADFVAQWGRRSDRILQHRAFRGSNGSVLWDAPGHSAGTTRLPAGGAVTDWNGDDLDDFVYQFYGTHVLSGANGTTMSSTGYELLFYFMPTIADVDGDNEDEVTLHGGYNEARTLEKDLTTTLWVAEEVDRPYPYGSVVQCGATSRLVEGSLINPATLKSTNLGGPQAGDYVSSALADGQAYATEADATAAGARLGQLTSTSVHIDLGGDGQAVALVGSSDGWLYAVDPCTASLVYSVELGAEVGAIAFADTDGDSLDEIVVSVGDGFLYVLRNAPVDAPNWVYDIDPPRGLTESDVDFIFHSDSMSAIWAPVADADAYQVAIVRVSDSEIVSSPAWQDVGNVTQATVSGLSLEDGEVYLFAVRALKTGAPSPDVPSDGVNVVLDGGGDAGPGGTDGGNGVDGRDVGGCCDGSPSSGTSSLVLVGLVLLVMTRRRRERA